MRRAFLLPLVLGGCFWGGGEASRVEDLAANPGRPAAALAAVPDRHPYGDPAGYRTGQWATYREGNRTITLAVTGEEAGAVWVEVIEEGEPRLVSARLTARSGEVLRAFGGEAGGAGSPQRLIQAAAPAARGEGTESVKDGTVTVDGRSLGCRTATRRTEDLEGRVREEVSVWSPAVPPLYAGSPHGGLVRRGAALELLKFGADARPSLQTPK